MDDKISFHNISDYSQSDSEDDYNDEEKKILQKVRRPQVEYSESEEEIYPLHSNSSSESDNNEDIADSDINDNDDDLPNERAWGKKKSIYYSTDYVDKDYGGLDEKDADAALFEEDEARNIQKRLMEQFDDEDFSLDVLKPINQKINDKINVEEDEEEVIKSDLSNLSKRQKYDLFIKESPEFLVLVEEFKTKLQDIIDYVAPILDISDKDIIEDNIDRFLKIRYEITWSYLIHIKFYLLLKSVRSNIKYHPVVKRLVQYKELCTQLESAYQQIYLPKIKDIMNNIKKNKFIIKKNDKVSNKKEKSLKRSNILSVLDTKHNDKKAKAKKIKINSTEDDSKKCNNLNSKNKKKIDIGDNTLQINTHLESIIPKINKKVSFQNDVCTNGSKLPEIENDEVKKRPITYQMAKNKGLTPRRKKEQRNPRVKNRNKYRQAKIRRKGAVREVKKELTRYEGESSGIKASVTKSIKIK